MDLIVRAFYLKSINTRLLDKGSCTRQRKGIYQQCAGNSESVSWYVYSTIKTDSAAVQYHGPIHACQTAQDSVWHKLGTYDEDIQDRLRIRLIRTKQIAKCHMDREFMQNCSLDVNTVGSESISSLETVSSDPTPTDTSDWLARHTLDKNDPLLYIIVVLSFYSIGVVFMLVKYLKTEREELEEEKMLEDFLKTKPRSTQEDRTSSSGRLALHALNAANVISQPSTSATGRITFVWGGLMGSRRVSWNGKAWTLTLCRET